MDVPKALQQHIDRQNGLVTRKQLLAAGLTRSQVRHALSLKGPWQHVVSGVYATFTGTLNRVQVQRAAILYAGDSAIITGSWACGNYGMRYMPRTGLRVLIGHGTRRAPVDLAEIQRTRKLPAVRWMNGLPYAEPARAALDAVADSRDLRTVRATLCEVVQRGLASAEQLAAAPGISHCRTWRTWFPMPTTRSRA